MTSIAQADARFARYRLIDDGESTAMHKDALLILLLVVLSWSVAAIAGFRGALTCCTALGCILALLGISNPRMAVFALGILVTLDSVSRTFLATGGLYRFNTLNFWLILMALLSGRNLMSRRDVPTIIFLGLAACVFAGLFFSPVPGQGVQHVLNLVAVPGMLVCLPRSSDKYGTWFWLGTINGTIGVLGSAALYLSESDRGNPNVWAYLPLTALFSTCLAISAADQLRHGRLWLLALGAANGWFVLLSGSRGAIVLAVCCLVFQITAVSGFRHQMALVGLLLFVTAAVLTSESGQASMSRWNRLFDNELSAAERTSGRSFLFQVGVHVFTQKPLGAGTGAYAHEGQPYAQAARAFSGNAMQSHSAWLKVLVENGVVGILLLAAYVGSFAYVALRRADPVMVRLGVLTSVVLAVGFLSTEFASKGLWLLPTGVSVLMARHVIRARVTTIQQC